MYPDPLRILTWTTPRSRERSCTACCNMGGLYEVLIASSAAEAVRRCTDPLVPRETDLDVILLNLDMHGGNGIEACRLCGRSRAVRRPGRHRHVQDRRRIARHGI